MFSLTGKIYVVTGAAGMLGRQHCDIIAKAGGTPILLDVEKTRVEAAATEVSKKHGVEAIGYVVDITNEASVEACAQTVLKKFGRVDGLINNAANNPKVEGNTGKDFSRLENFPLEIWLNDLAVGLTGSFLCSKHFGPLIARQGGSIINISSDLGVISPDQRLYRKPGLAEDQQPVKPITYSVTKSGLLGLTRYLATYWADKGVRCNALCPGGVENNQDPAFLKEVTARIPLGRLARVDEYQGCILFLLSDASSYMNGAVMNVDGGRTTW